MFNTEDSAAALPSPSIDADPQLAALEGLLERSLIRRRIVAYIIRGDGVKQIAHSLGRSHHTIRDHLKVLHQAVGGGRVALVVAVVRLGFARGERDSASSERNVQPQPTDDGTPPPRKWGIDVMNFIGNLFLHARLAPRSFAAMEYVTGHLLRRRGDMRRIEMVLAACVVGLTVGHALIAAPAARADETRKACFVNEQTHTCVCQTATHFPYCGGPNAPTCQEIFPEACRNGDGPVIPGGG